MIIDGNRIIPGEGYLYVTNGVVCSECVYLGTHDSPENWHDTNEAIQEEPSAEELEKSARYLLDQKLVTMPAQEQPDYFHEHETEPNYFG